MNSHKPPAISEPLRRVLNLLPGAQRSGSEWQAHCPAHEDKNPSLSITAGRDGRVLLKCHAGCSVEEITSAIGLSTRDLFADPELTAKPRILRAYPYHDADGTVAYEVVRFEPKAFRQRRPDGLGGWIWNLRGIEPLLFRLPQVTDAVDTGRQVLIVEGEKDVETLESLGQTATCNSGGAGRWPSSAASTLRNARVVIVPDNDQAGWKHAQVVAEALTGCAREVRILELPDLPQKGDISDWKAAGGTASQLQGLLDAAPPWNESLSASKSLADVCELDQQSVPDAPHKWETPIPLTIPTTAFPVHALPLGVARHVSDVAETTQVPIDMPGLLSLGVLAAAAAGRFEVSVGRTHREPLNLYAVIAASPGTRKSEVMRNLIFPLEEREAELIAEAKPSVAMAQERRLIADQRLKELRSKAAKEKDPAARECIAAEAELLAAELPEVSALPRLLVDDATPERLASLAAENEGCIATFSTEGGVFGQMAGRYNEKGGPNLDIYLKGHAGDPIRVDRSNGRSDIIPQPALTFGLMVQPQVLRSLPAGAILHGRGLPARFLYAVPRSLVGERIYRNRPIAEESRRSYALTVRAILSLPRLEGTARPCLRIEGEALTVWARFHDEVEQSMGPGGDMASMAEWGAKLAGAVARVSGVLHLASRAREGELTTLIETSTVHNAIEVGRYLIEHARAAYALMCETTDMALARRVLDWIERRAKRGASGEFSLRDLHQDVRTDKSGDLLPALTVLVERGYVAELPCPPRTRGRPPSSRYAINPLLEIHPQNPQYLPKPSVGESSVGSVVETEGHEMLQMEVLV